MTIIRQLIHRAAYNTKIHFGIFATVLIVLTLIMTLSYYPLCPGQDFHFHFQRFNALIQSFSDRTFPYYIDSGALAGYGYFTKAFYSDFVLIPFALIGYFTNDVTGYLSMIFTMTILCGIFTYHTINVIYKSSYAAAIGSILYTFAIYRLLDLYHRAALGEALSFTFVPIVILGLYYIIKGDYRKWYVLAIGFSLMVLTHIISTVLMAVTSAIILIIYYKPLFRQPKRIFWLMVAAIASAFLSAYYLFPIIEQMASDTFYYQTRRIMSLAQDSKMEFHWIIWGLFSGIIHPKQIFVVGTGLLLTCAVALRLFVWQKSPLIKSADIGVIIGLFYIFASSVFFPWSVFPFRLLNFIQLPWRLYEFSSFFFAMAGGYYLSVILKNSPVRAFVAGGLIVLVTVFIISSDAQLYKDVRCNGDIMEEAAIGNDYHLGGYEYISDKVPSVPYLHERGDTVEYSNPGTSVLYNNADKLFTLNVALDSADTLTLPLLYYKGYVYGFVDGKQQVHNAVQSSDGLVQIPVNYSGTIYVYYKGTLTQKIGFYVSLISVLAFCVYIFMQRKRK